MSERKDKDMYTVSEFAALTNVTAETLRFYHRKGLLSPSFVDPVTGYRYYSMHEYETVGVIQALQSLGIPLKEIKNYLESKDIEYSYTLLLQHYRELCKEIDRLLDAKRYIKDKLDSINSVRSENTIGKIVNKSLPERTGYSTNIPCSNYRQYQHETAKLMENYNKNLFLSNSFAVLFNQSSNIPCFNSLVFNIDRPRKIQSSKIILPEGNYVTLQFKGTFETASKHLERVKKYLAEKNFTPSGEIILLCVIDENYTNLTDEMITEIQVPITRCS